MAAFSVAQGIQASANKVRRQKGCTLERKMGRSWVWLQNTNSEEFWGVETMQALGVGDGE